MDFFEYREGEGFCEDVSLRAIKDQVGTPTYVYSYKTLSRHLEEVKKAFQSYPTLPCFAVKANSNISILREIFNHGYGADLVSLGELKRSSLAGVKPQEIVFSGVGKQRHEIKAALEHGILAFNVESPFELQMIQEVARELDQMASINLRVNPNIDAATNPKITTGMYTSKFGIPEDEALRLAEDVKNLSHVKLIGVACHIGSQITNLEPLGEAAKRMTDLALRLLDAGHRLEVIDMGGGLGIRYDQENPPSLEAYALTLINEVKRSNLRLVIEPGRVLAGNIGVLLTEVVGTKTTPEKTFVIVDAAMNDLLRPSMYDSYHDILPQKEPQPGGKQLKVDIVGPICESGDFLGKDRLLPSLDQGDLVFVRGVGAYGATMASNYNSRARPAEVLVKDSELKVIRKRESLDDIWRLEI